ncbi:hypothetical protein [Actinokineospora sp. NBRC 105648]|uniref:hypothetical protein n=1 Tax=Actinokineospora sp. NBRC 105648 TaxID=3032206 RepID=UPI0024A0F760|nr:hypothetical protein [Actinokineospora sp. NBRC 105648]GLZ36767.1 hypothetical protein Acsp05_03920 [Actinokineospora sp. NBRC 105648]
MANQSVMSTPIFDELLREMTEGAAAEESKTEDEDPAKAKAPTPGGGRRRHRSE